MLIFLYGPDTYRLSRKANQIVTEYKKRKSGLDFSVIDAVSSNPKDFFASLRQTSLFQEKKFFVVKDPISNKDFKEALVENIESVVNSGHNIVFCQEGKVLKNDRLLTAFKKCAEVQEFTALEGPKLIAWIVGEFESLGGSINNLAAQMLALRAGSDLWRLENEIQKLVHRWPSREILSGDVESGVIPETDINIFKTVDAVAARDKQQALRLIKEHTDKGDHPLYLLAMIVSQFKNLVLVKAAEHGTAARPQAGLAVTAARLGIHPYVFGKTVAQARRFSLDELKNIYRKICQIDFDIKTGKVGPEVGLDLLIASI